MFSQIWDPTFKLIVVEVEYFFFCIKPMTALRWRFRQLDIIINSESSSSKNQQDTLSLERMAGEIIAALRIFNLYLCGIIHICNKYLCIDNQVSCMDKLKICPEKTVFFFANRLAIDAQANTHTTHGQLHVHIWDHDGPGATKKKHDHTSKCTQTNVCVFLIHERAFARLFMVYATLRCFPSNYAPETSRKFGMETSELHPKTNDYLSPNFASNSINRW